MPRFQRRNPKAVRARRRRNPMKSKRRGYKTSSIVKRTLNPFPQRMIVSHKYAEGVTLTITTGTQAAGYNWNLNSIYDPNRSGTGHQPYGRDQYAGIYQKYRVIACHYNMSVVGGNDVCLYALPSNEAVTVYTSAQARETPRCRYVNQAGAQGPRVLKGKVYLPSLLGRTKAQYMADEDCQAAVGSNPNEVCILNTGVALPGDNIVGSSISYNLAITLTYIVEWFDPITQSQS